ncbi:MAG: serine/threonine protein kinase, partial [Clostridia bacterium]|nr:serine/threonine protein kinase [Clostridia bacterium]
MQGVVLGKRYRITEPLGSGGMAVVYKGEDLLLGRPVTIKILREQYAGDQAFVARFRQEAQAVARLSHPNIVSIYDVGEEGPYHYLVMEYVPGWTLKELLRQRAPLPVAEAIGLMIQLLDALEHAHANGIIHRDIKP